MNKKTLFISYVFATIFVLSLLIHLPSSSQALPADKQEPIVSVAFTDVSANFSTVEILKVKLLAYSDLTINYSLVPGSEIVRNMSKGDTIETLIVSVLQNSTQEEKGDVEVVSSLHDACGGRLVSGSVGSTGQQDIRDIEPFISNTPASGTYNLIEPGERFSVGMVLDRERFIQLVEPVE